MKKKIQKPFDLEAYKRGAKVETRSGNPVRILCTEMKGQKNPIVAVVDFGTYENFYS